MNFNLANAFSSAKIISFNTYFGWHAFLQQATILIIDAIESRKYSKQTSENTIQRNAKSSSCVMTVVEFFSGTYEIE